jgi:DNA-binding NarL/FixJ family response regulator
MLNIMVALALMAGSMTFCWSIVRKMIRRTQTLERELQRISSAVSQMAEIQMKAHKKLTARFEDMEERIMELSIPSQDSSLPLERRHQVLSLARQGVALEDIAKRLKAPIGEAELILNLGKYMGGENAPAGKINGQVGQYA